jgi:hypothetical protein
MGQIAKLKLIIPPGASSIKIDGEEGGRVVLEFSDAELPEAFKLAAFGRNKVLTVTFEAE